jgi:hypothetical protein
MNDRITPNAKRKKEKLASLWRACMAFIENYLYSIPDPESGAFLTPVSGIRYV